MVHCHKLGHRMHLPLTILSISQRFIGPLPHCELKRAQSLETDDLEVWRAKVKARVRVSSTSPSMFRIQGCPNFSTSVAPKWSWPPFSPCSSCHLTPGDTSTGYPKPLRAGLYLPPFPTCLGQGR
jgi:hypothetical protein